MSPTVHHIDNTLFRPDPGASLSFHSVPKRYFNYTYFVIGKFFVKSYNQDEVNAPNKGGNRWWTGRDLRDFKGWSGCKSNIWPAVLVSRILPIQCQTPQLSYYFPCICDLFPFKWIPNAKQSITADYYYEIFLFKAKHLLVKGHLPCVLAINNSLFLECSISPWNPLELQGFLKFKLTAIFLSFPISLARKYANSHRCHCVSEM